MTLSTRILLSIPLYAAMGGGCLVAGLLGGPGLLAIRCAAACVGAVMVVIATYQTAAVAGFIDDCDGAPE